MLQFFRSFQWAGALVVLVCALALRSALFGLGIAEETSLEGLGPWGQFLAEIILGDFGRWIFGVLLVSAVGVFASFTIQHFRLVNAGLVPAIVCVLIGSSAGWWLGFSPYLAGSILIAAAAQRLFLGYRFQGAALPVYDCGLLIGAAWLIAPPFLWFALWAGLALGQLRKFRLSEQFNLLIGILTLPLLYCLYVFVFSAGDQSFASTIEAWNSLFDGFFNLSSVSRFFVDNSGSGIALWLPVAVLLVFSCVAIYAFGLLTTRRPIQEQRASRMWYTMLAIGWLALLFSSTSGKDSLALVLYPLAVLLGIWLSELPRQKGDLVFLLTLCVVIGGYAWIAVLG